LEVRKKLDAEHAITLKQAEQIQQLQTRVAAQRREYQPAGQIDKQREKKLKVLEDRLEHATTRFHESDTQNRKLRDNVSQLERERQLSAAEHDKLLRKYEKQEVALNMMEEKFRTATAARDAAQADIAALSQQFEREKDKWQTEMRQMQSFIENERRVCESFHTTLTRPCRSESWWKVDAGIAL